MKRLIKKADLETTVNDLDDLQRMVEKLKGVVSKLENIQPDVTLDQISKIYDEYKFAAEGTGEKLNKLIGNLE